MQIEQDNCNMVTCAATIYFGLKSTLIIHRSEAHKIILDVL